jgi:hypothetical protein
MVLFESMCVNTHFSLSCCPSILELGRIRSYTWFKCWVYLWREVWKMVMWRLLKSLLILICLDSLSFCSTIYSWIEISLLFQKNWGNLSIFFYLFNWGWLDVGSWRRWTKTWSCSCNGSNRTLEHWSSRTKTFLKYPSDFIPWNLAWKDARLKCSGGECVRNSGF